MEVGVTRDKLYEYYLYVIIQCELNPKIPYTQLSDIIKKQKAVSITTLNLNNDNLSVIHLIYFNMYMY